MNPDRPATKHILIKMANVKGGERILKVVRQGQLLILKAAPIRLSTDFSAENFQVRRDCLEIFKVMKSKELIIRIAPPIKVVI